MTTATTVPEQNRHVFSLQNGHIGWQTTFLVLLSRTLLFLAWQMVFALFFGLIGEVNPWKTAAAWWPVWVVFANLTSLMILLLLNRREGTKLTSLFRFQRATLGRDLLNLLVGMLILTPFMGATYVLSALILYGDMITPGEILVQPLPVWAAIFSLLLFPITVVLSELPTYFGFVMPRIEQLSGKKWLAVLLPGIMLSVQHAALPLVFDTRFILWRATEFLFFAIGLGVLIRLRPRLLPYLMVIHGLMDLQVAIILLSLAR